MTLLATHQQWFGSRFQLVDNDGVYKGGFEAGFSTLPPDELKEEVDPLPESAKDLPCAYVPCPKIL